MGKQNGEPKPVINYETFTLFITFGFCRIRKHQNVI